MVTVKLLDEIVRAAGQAETIRQETGFWPVLGHPRVESIGSAMFSDGERAERFRTALEGSYLDKHLRPAMLAFWWEALNLRTILDDEDQKDRVQEYSEALFHCVDAVAPLSIESDAQLRWELDVAATTRNLPRVLRLLDELRRRPNPEAFGEIAIRMLFLLTACNFLEPLPSGTWDPAVQRPDYEGFYQVYSMLAWSVAMQPGRVRVSPPPNGPTTLRKDMAVSDVRAIRDWVELARDGGVAFSQEAAAIEAWSTYCLGLADGRSADVERAGTLYESAEDFTLPGGQLDKPWRWEAATIAYQDAGSLAKALSCVEHWAELAPGDARAQRKLAELSWRVGNLEDAIDALVRAAADDAPSDRAWEHTILLQLGLEKLSGDSSSKAIERAAERTPLKETGHRLSAWVLPWFDSLSEKAKQRFWFGLYAVSSPELLESTGQATWDNAGDNFGEALAFELKHRIIEPFSTEDARGKIDPRDEHWVRLANGRATLGELIECLLSSLRPTNDAARTLRKRLDAHHKKLLRELIDSEKDLRRLYRLRGAAQHGTVSEASVRDIFLLVCRVLAALHAK
jgi:tetratricopeptide (TPR) repeat protein